MWTTITAYLIFAVLLVVLLLIFVYLVLPQYAFKWLMSLSRWRSGLKSKVVRVGDRSYGYSERGSPGQPTLLALHGFSANKDSWITMIQKLPRGNHRIITLDLPGHGMTSIEDNAELTPDFFAERIHEFVETLGLKDFHLVGVSLGGLLSGVYAAKYPNNVRLLSLLCPGMNSPIETDFLQKLRKKECALIIETPEQLVDMLKLTLHKPPNVPKQILKGALYWRIPYNAFYCKMVDILASEIENGDVLVKVAKDIRCPSQIIWGRQDAMLHVSGAQLLQQHLADCRQMDLIDECGHEMFMDRPGASLSAILTFRRKCGLD